MAASGIVFSQYAGYHRKEIFLNRLNRFTITRYEMYYFKLVLIDLLSYKI